VGTPVTLLGHGVQAEAHARVAGTIAYELVTAISRAPERTRCAIIDS
jgi:alanine racemase